jgi:ribosome-binding ATPase YchF (GTP1/OBG family)
MNISVLGLPQSGKSTFLKSLLNISETDSLPDVCTLKVKDERLEEIGKLLGHNKLTYPEISFNELDILTLNNKSAELKGIESIQKSYGILLVIKCFDIENTAQISRDIDEITTELIVSDAIIIENVIERRQKSTKGKTKQEVDGVKIELELLDNLKKHLDSGNALNSFEFKAGDIRKLTGYNLITLKPIFVLLNSDTEMIEISNDQEINKIANKFTYPSKLEMELSELSESESTEFRESLNIENNLNYKVIQSLFKSMDKIIFITAGDQEIRAWEIQTGDNSLIASSKIHSDISKGFIRAEVIEYETFIKLGSWNQCKKEGKVKGNGKEYIVQDGDVINFLHS